MSCNKPKKTRIVLAGGGFAGLYAAKYFDKALARRTDIEVTLIAARISSSLRQCCTKWRRVTFRQVT